MSAAIDSLSGMAGSMASANMPGELVLVDRLCERWARWAGNQFAGVDWPRWSMSAKMIEWHEKGVGAEHLHPAAGKDKAPEGVMMIDLAVARLPECLRRCIAVEYFTGGPRSVKAKRLGITTHDFRQNLRSALWAIYVRLDAALEDR